MGVANGRPYNHYRCTECACITTTKDLHAGVTPFMIPCRVTLDCRGMAQSSFYRGPQDPSQAHDAEFYFPTPGELDTVLQSLNEFHRQVTYDHLNKGGLLLRDVNRPSMPTNSSRPSPSV